MKLPTFYAKQISTTIFVIIFTLGVPLQALAQGASVPPNTTVESSTATTTVEQSSNGTDRPTGVAAKTYKFNESTGLWENEHYTWNPASKETLAKVTPEYTYNADTGLYDTRIWEYVPASSTYVLTDVAVLNPPADAVKHGGPAPQPESAALAASSDYPTDGTPIPVQATTTPTGPTTNPSSPANSMDGGNTVDTISDDIRTIKSDATTVLNTVVNSSATSGGALLQGNRNAGDATTGDASATATVINLLQSTSSLAGNGVAVFNTDIQGDVEGDLIIDPASFMQPAGLTNADLNGLDVTSRTEGVIQNDINLAATSGDASIIGNTTAGNATTGNATAVANVLNLINSVVAANQSFVGTINIYGNFRGDILVPTDSLNALLAANGSEQPIGATSTASNLNLNDNQQIVNNIDLAAASGNTTATGNRHVGTATSGDALTRLTILNLTGKKVNAANSLLVFVNVLGTWVGLIMDAPSGTTAAALGGGITASTDLNAVPPNATAPDGLSGDISVNNNASIVNNITARAQSGNASAVDNTRVGNVTTGTAKTSASIVNMIGSNFSLSHWFGVLFINVFGSWHGNFGTDDAPEEVIAGGSGGSGTADGVVPQSSTSGQAARLFTFNSAGSRSPGLSEISSASLNDPEQYELFMNEVNGVLAANAEIVETIVSKNGTPDKAFEQSQFSLAALPLVLGFAGLSVVGTERIRSIRNKMKLQHYYRR